MPPGIASSVHKNHAEDPFGLIPTVQTAIENNVEAIQLYINDRFASDAEYLLQLVEALREYVGVIIIHLPDHFQNITTAHIAAAELLINSFPDRDIRVLTHYHEGMTTADIPWVNNQPVGLENSLTGIFDPDHVMRALRLAREAETFFVFDHGRIMYGENPELTYEFVRHVVNNLLDHKRDIIHSADKTAWNSRYRDSWAALGDPTGIGFPLLTDIANFSARGGVVIFEHEDVALALESVRNVES